MKTTLALGRNKMAAPRIALKQDLTTYSYCTLNVIGPLGCPSQKFKNCLSADWPLQQNIWINHRTEDGNLVTMEYDIYLFEQAYIATTKVGHTHESRGGNFRVPNNEVTYFSNRCSESKIIVWWVKLDMHPTSNLVRAGVRQHVFNDELSQAHQRRQMQQLPALYLQTVKS